MSRPWAFIAITWSVSDPRPQALSSSRSSWAPSVTTFCGTGGAGAGGGAGVTSSDDWGIDRPRFAPAAGVARISVLRSATGPRVDPAGWGTWPLAAMVVGRARSLNQRNP